MRQSIIRIDQVETLTGVPKSTLYKWMKKGTFPRPLPLGERSVGWRMEAVQNWIDEREMQQVV